MSEIAVGFEAKVSVTSRYQRLYRFFRQFKIDYAVLAHWMIEQFPLSQKFYLTLDRTNWFWGKGKINILTLAIAYEGIAIPILWQALDKAGNASALEHQGILQRFIDLFGTTRIQGVLADREFTSGDLLCWLNQQKIPCYIRIKEDSLVKMKNKTVCKAVELFNDLQPKVEKHFPMNVWLYGQRVYLSGSRAQNGELMIVVTHQHADNAISIYLRRWEIETLFSCLKGRGFRFEDTHITQCDRLEKVMALLAIAFFWAHKIGEWRAEKKPIAFKCFRQGIRPQHSLFRYGFNFLREILLNTRSIAKLFKHYLNFLTGPPNIHPIT